MRPDDIPEDVWEKAKAVMRDSPFAMDASDYVEHTADLIARAILAERERCAKIGWLQSKQGATHDQIAAAIRGPHAPE